MGLQESKMTASPTTEENLDENDKKKEKKKSSFNSKIVIRRLPWSMTEAEFKNCVDPLPEHDYFRFVKADYSFENDAATRVYINFIHQEDIFNFQDRFDGYVFVDSKGNEHTAVVEFAPNQKVPSSKESKRKDPKLDSLDQDPEYQKFLELLQGPQEAVMPTIEQVLEEIEAKEREIKAGRGLDNQTTPLLQFMKEKKDEKIKKREDQREARRKRDEDRKKRHEEERARRKELKEKEIREKRDREKAPDRDRDDRAKERREPDKRSNKQREESAASTPSTTTTVSKELTQDEREQ